MRSSVRRRAIAGATTAALACTLALTPLTAASAAPAPTPPVAYSADDAAISLTPIGTHRTGVFEASAAEIVAEVRVALDR